MAVNRKIGQDVKIKVRVKYTGNVKKTLYVLAYMYDKWSTYRNYLVGVKSAEFNPGEEKTLSISTKIPAFYAIGQYACNGVTAKVYADDEQLDSESDTCAVNVLPSVVELKGYMKEMCLCKGVDTSTEPWTPIEKTTEFEKNDEIYVFLHAHDVYFPNAYDVLRAAVTGVVLEDWWIPGTSVLKWYPSEAGYYDVYGYTSFIPPSEGWPANVRIWVNIDFKEPYRTKWDAKISQ